MPRLGRRTQRNRLGPGDGGERKVRLPDVPPGHPTAVPAAARSPTRPAGAPPGGPRAAAHVALLTKAMAIDHVAEYSGKLHLPGDTDTAMLRNEARVGESNEKFLAESRNGPWDALASRRRSHKPRSPVGRRVIVRNGNGVSCGWRRPGWIRIGRCRGRRPRLPGDKAPQRVAVLDEFQRASPARSCSEVEGRCPSRCGWKQFRMRSTSRSHHRRDPLPASARCTAIRIARGRCTSPAATKSAATPWRRRSLSGRRLSSCAPMFARPMNVEASEGGHGFIDGARGIQRPCEHRCAGRWPGLPLSRICAVTAWPRFSWRPVIAILAPSWAKQNGGSFADAGGASGDESDFVFETHMKSFQTT